MATIEYKNFDKNVVVTGAYTGGANQEIIALPYTPNGFLVQLTPTGGSASIQASVDDTNWETWVKGDITATAIAPVSPIRYLRVIHNTATASALTVWGY